MPIDNDQLDLKTLRKFAPLKNLSEKQLILVASQQEIRRYKRKEVIIELGSSDNFGYFLVRGSLELTANDGKKSIVRHDSPVANNPIAHLRPRQYRVRAIEETLMLILDWQSLLEFSISAAKKQDDRSTFEQNSGSLIDDIRSNFQRDLESNDFNLPSLPDVAIRVREALDFPTCSASDISKIITTDPSIAVKIISAAQSPLFHGVSEIKSCDQAVVRLGTNTVKQLVQVYVLRELFDTKNIKLKVEFEKLWTRTTEVSAIAAVLAKKIAPHLDPEKAMLAGFVHDIGVLPALTYINEVERITDDDRIDGLINDLKAELGELMIKQWGWDQEFVSVAKHSDNWSYESKSEFLDYVDIIQIAKIHWGIGKQHNYPPLNKVSAFAKIETSELTPQTSLKIMDEAKEEIHQAQKLVDV